MLGGEVEEGEQRLPILRQAADCLIVLGAVFVGEHIDRRLGRREGWRAAYLAKVGLHIDLNQEGDEPRTRIKCQLARSCYRKPSAANGRANILLWLNIVFFAVGGILDHAPSALIHLADFRFPY